jgi:hypothetical protein
MNGSIAENIRLGMNLLDQSAAEMLTYRRGSQACEWYARPARPNWIAMIDNTISEEWEGLDWIGDRQKLTFSDGMITPQRGDVIERFIDGETIRYSVLAPTGKKLYELPAYNQRIIIHTKQVP